LEYLRETGQTVADRRFEAEAELAGAKLLAVVERAQAPVTDALVVRYYEQHQRRFLVPEERELLITNRKTASQANAIIREVHGGKRFARLSERERRVRSPYLYDPRIAFDSYLERVLFTAPPHVLIGPVKFRVDYFVFEVLHVTPARQRALAQVKDQIRTALLDEQRRRAVSAFASAWTRRWTAKTDCAAGYVIVKCRQNPSLAAVSSENGFLGPR
jgi:foldase protein PrsA